jgi:hypothetical protein
MIALVSFDAFLWFVRLIWYLGELRLEYPSWWKMDGAEEVGSKRTLRISAGNATAGVASSAPARRARQRVVKSMVADDGLLLLLLLGL